jgi:hypothetical protein
MVNGEMVNGKCGNLGIWGNREWGMWAGWESEGMDECGGIGRDTRAGWSI